MLRRIEPYVTFGYPSKSLITKLVYKRGFVKINKQRVPINDNAMIEDNLGKFGLKCVEDLIHEIATCGPHFKEANNFIWTFKLKSPTKGFVHKRQSYINGGDWGNREDKIAALIKRMI
mmetsp:Transcript_23604/g.3913  ORF Transcript_23604/g.3913 Transcript_23604/m.3913 type:complete len:118 (-) Transcript_23604:41-394(-)